MPGPSRYAIASCLLTGGVLAGGAAEANSTGITGRSGNPATGGSTCAACHSGGSYNYSTATLSGPTTVDASSTNAYTLNFNNNGGTPAAAAGFNLSATGGTLVDPNTSDNTVRKSGSELTHGAPRSPSSGNFSWSFNWTAPGTAGNRTFYFCNNPVNLNGANTLDGAIRCGSAVITVSPPPPAPPVANDNSYSTAENTPRTVAAPGVLGNDTDVNGDPLTAILVDDVTHGALSFNSDGGFTYTPDTSFTGPDSFTYKANDGALDSNTATVTLTVTLANAAPEANADSYSTGEDEVLVVAAPGVLANDPDEDGDELTASKVSDPANGSVTLNADGSFAYTPNTDFSGTDSFTYQASDGFDDSGVATVTITVIATPVTPPPGGSTIGGAGGGGGGAMPWLLWLLLLPKTRSRKNGDRTIFCSRK